MPGDFPGIDTQLHRCVVQPRAVQVQLQPVLTGKAAGPGQVFQGQDLALHGVFQRQQTGAGEMEIVRLDRRGNLGKVQRAIGLHFQRLRLDRAEYRRPSTFVLIGVRLLADDVFVTALAMGHQAQQVAHGARRDKQCGSKPQAVCQFGFQAVDRRIFAIHIVTGGGSGHRLEHAGGGLGDGVAAKINHTHDSGLVNRGNRVQEGITAVKSMNNQP
ncbi:hypothetical protein D3C76_1083250 [compost metagenome]